MTKRRSTRKPPTRLPTDGGPSNGSYVRQKDGSLKPAGAASAPPAAPAPAASPAKPAR